MMPSVSHRIVALFLLAALLTAGCSTATDPSSPPAVEKTREQLVQQYVLASMKADQVGDFALAKAELIKAAELGDLFSQSRLGMRLRSGKHFTQNYEEARYWLTKASEQGNGRAEYALMCMYLNGEGGPKDEATAFAYCLRAANHGHLDACSYLGAMYADGTGTPQNIPEAVRWVRSAAARGNAQGQRILAEFYLRGIGMEKSPVHAYEWATLAIKAGDPYAMKHQFKAVALLSPQQRHEADQFVEQWKPQQ